MSARSDKLRDPGILVSYINWLLGGVAMIDRDLKAIFSALLGLMALFYLLQNLINLDQAYASLDYVMSQADHAAYPGNLLPALGPPWTRAAAWLVFAGEFVTAFLALLGAWKMARARRLDADEFAAAKKWAKLGAGMAIIVWFGFFHVFGAAGYQMWQTEIGAGSFQGAFYYAAFGFFVLLYLGQREDEVA
jgi:predicted small integral membrane protein